MRLPTRSAVVILVAWVVSVAGSAGCGGDRPAGDARREVTSPRPSRPRAAPSSPVPQDPFELARRLVAGSVAPEDLPAERVAGVVAHLLVPRTDYEESDLLRRLDVLRRLGPAAGAATDAIVTSGGRSEVTELAARAALDAVDPDRTLRIAPFLACSRFSWTNHMDVRHGLWSAGPAVIPHLVAVLEGQVEGNDQMAADLLGEFGPAAAAALPALRAALRGDTSLLRELSAVAIFRVTEGREVAVAQLVGILASNREIRDEVVALHPGAAGELAGLLGSADVEVRASAARVLADLAPATEGIASALAAGIVHWDTDVSNGCAETLVRLGPAASGAIPDLVSHLNGDDVSAQWRAANALAATGDRETALPALRASWTSGSRGEARSNVAEAIVRFGPEQADVLVEPLVAALAEEHTLGRRGGFRTVRGWWWAAETLGGLGVAAEPAIPALIAALDEGSGARDPAEQALAKIGRPAVGPLAEAVATSPREEVRIGAAEALARMGPDATGAVSALRCAFGDTSVRVRAAAASALLVVEPGAADAARVLESTFEAPAESPRSDEPGDDVVSATRRSYEDMARLLRQLARFGRGDPAALAAVRRAQASDARSIRLAACDAERRITGDARPLVAECQRQIRSGDADSAFAALAEAGPAAADARETVEWIVGCHPSLVFAAEPALAAVGADDEVRVTALANVVATGTDSDVVHACERLASLGPAAAAAVPRLASKLERMAFWPQRQVIEALGAIGPAAAPAIPQIRLRLTNDYADTRAAAREALRRIEPPR